MSLTKRTYVDGETVIIAQNLNDIQDAIIENETDIVGKVDTNQGIANEGKAMVVGSDGNLSPEDITIEVDPTLTQEGEAADAKATGDAIRTIEDITGDGQLSGFTATDLTGAANELKGDTNELKNTLNHKADVIYDTASGDIASFPDGADGLPVKDLTVGIEPVQDLHGYDNPWPAGGGKNLFDISLLNKGGVAVSNGVAIGTAGAFNSEFGTPEKKVPFNGEENTVYAISFSIYTNASAASSGNGLQIFLEYSDESSVIALNISNATTSKTRLTAISAEGKTLIGFCVSYGSASGNTWYLSDLQIELGSTVSTYEPYSNICPISGWTGANVTRTGKNLWNWADSSDSDLYDPNNGKCGWHDSNDKVLVPQSVFKENTQYTLILKGYRTNAPNSGTAYGFNARFDYTDGTYQSISYVSGGSEVPVVTVVTSSSGKTIKEIHSTWHSGNTILYYEESGLFEGVLTAADFVPYSGTTIPISWQSSAGTVYGGTLDVTTGVLTVDRAKITFTGDETFWKASSYLSQNSYYMATEEYLNPDLNITTLLCNMYKPLTYRQAQSQGWPRMACCPTYEQSKGGVAFFADFFDNNVNTWKSYLSNLYSQDTPLEVVLEIANKIIIAIDPVTVNTLLGHNNIWADCGPSTVEYPCDTKLYIQKINTPTDDDMIADANIASGQYFIVNNNLYLSTTAILAGDPIKPGTNCTLTNLAAALNAINS